MQLSLNEITLLPSYYPTNITSRSQVNPFIDDKLPVFVAPMTSVVNEDNLQLFSQNKFIPILPRMIPLQDRLEFSKYYWVALSLQEFIQVFTKCSAPELIDYRYHILIDIANGHMKAIYDAVSEAKQEYGKAIQVMIGNIAHPQLFVDCCKAGVDYCRVGIGGGTVCSTSVQCGIHASHHWIIEEIKKLSEYYQPNRTKLIADGGINTLDKAIKALGIGYDYVMMGKCFAQCEEACGETKVGYFDLQGIFHTPDDTVAFLPESYYKTFRKYYGMASEQGQIDISGGCTKNPEGIETWVPVDNTLQAFSTKFEAALRSTMSYTGAHNLYEFTHNTKYDIQSIEEFKSYYK